MSRRQDDYAPQRLASIVESAEDAIVSQDTAGIITSWNRSAERIFGFTAAEAIGQSFLLIVPRELHQSDTEIMQRVVEGQTVAHHETVRRHKDGRRIDVSLAVSPIVSTDRVVTGISVIARDITESNRLQRIARHFEAIIASSDDAIVSKDLNGTVLSWNHAAERMFGYASAEMVGQSIRMIIPDDRQAEEDAVLARIRRGERVEHYETVRQHKSGRLVPISLTVSPLIDERGRVFGASKIARDTSEQARAEVERARLARIAEEAGRLKDEFLATLSHELRSPLNAVVGYVQLLRSDVLPQERRAHALDVVARNLTSLNQIVEDVLDISRIVSGKLRLDVQAVDLASLVNTAVESVRPAAEAKGIRLITLVDPEPSFVSGDPDRLHQVLWNLLANAVKFNKQEGRVEVRLEHADAHVVVTVSDTGIGIPADFLPHVFERFRQADAGAGRAHAGLGLGLAITRQLVELHGGHVSASSAGVGAGAVFRVALPARSAGASVDRGRPTLARSTRSDELPLPDLHGIRIVVVDDDPDALVLVREIVEPTGAVVLTTSSPDTALAELTDRPTDVLISDLGMPHVTGFDLIAAVRRSVHPHVRAVPAVALTAFARSEDRVKALRSGFQLHVAKPVDPSELVTAIAELVRRPKSEEKA